MKTTLSISLPNWLCNRYDELAAKNYTSDEDKIALALTLAENNVKHQTGGPFGAAIFNSEGKLLSVGVNLVTSAHLSTMHAEVTAICFAQASLNNYDLSGKELTLASSAEPCAMCTGAIPWSGVKRLIFSAADADVRNIGFDEGDKPHNWIECYNKRGIEVVPNLNRDRGIKILASYQGTLYNGS